MIRGKAPGPSQVSLQLIAASGGVGIQMMATEKINVFYIYYR